MPLQSTIRRAVRRLVQLYVDAAKDNASRGDIPLATRPFSNIPTPAESAARPIALRGHGRRPRSR
ncbi:hypothetical protein ACFY12_25005 [Streptomyces sp. NPDC001339]|uniref:hypothetical protein n=1 Tax=Streptomyces sp. NPDC001339 TaxID=3364563 RepID=UPI0036911C6F